MFYINGAKECWQYSYAAMPLGSRFVSFTISRLISQAANMLSCAVNFLNVCPFLHLHRLPFKQILKTMGFVGWFLLFVSIWGLIVHLLWGEGGSHFEKAENIFKPSPPLQIRHSLLEMTNLILSCSPPINLTLPPAYCSYKSCWGSQRTSSKVVCMRSVFTIIYGCYVQFQFSPPKTPLPIATCDAPLSKNKLPKRIKILKQNV